mmetsp:Transcript_60055/g.131578  ORF Transcript_60055/g.131578 Transcript_60055/m.131578 type:complete len:234 (+) Transcript_60055:217-918(+)
MALGKSSNKIPSNYRGSSAQPCKRADEADPVGQQEAGASTSTAAPSTVGGLEQEPLAVSCRSNSSVPPSGALPPTPRTMVVPISPCSRQVPRSWVPPVATPVRQAFPSGFQSPQLPRQRGLSADPVDHSLQTPRSRFVGPPLGQPMFSPYTPAPAAVPLPVPVLGQSNYRPQASQSWAPPVATTVQQGSYPSVLPPHPAQQQQQQRPVVMSHDDTVLYSTLPADGRRSTRPQR